MINNESIITIVSRNIVINMHTNKNVIKIALIAWLIIAGIYISHTPHSDRSHDFAGHVEYTEIIYNKHRFPKPLEGWETYHPPLYYLINSFLSPVKLNTEKMEMLHKGEFRIGLERHINLVQYMSVVYGAIALWLIAWFLPKITENTMSQLLTLLFICTTPRYVFVFSTYNNDSLATVLCIGMIVLSYKLYLSWSWKVAIGLLIVTTAGIYTKYTTVFCMIVICLICCRSLLKQKLPDLFQTRIITIFILSIVLFTPWMFFHNHYYTGKLLPVMWEDKINKRLNINEIKNTLSTVFKDPLLQKSNNPEGTREWDDPWAHGYDCPTTKQHDYPAFVFVTSILSEYVFVKPSVKFIWAILWIHLLAYIIGGLEIFKSNLTKLSVWFILLSHTIHIVNIARITIPVYGCFMDYRYLSWNWIPWSILYVSALSNKSYRAWILNKAMIIGIIIQIFILSTIAGTGT